jgi:SAM-dependent methyltransferase
MELRQADIKKINAFLGKIKKDVYPEPPSETHTEITKKMIEFFMNKYGLMPHSEILDIGCGQGLALDIFTHEGYQPVGITMDAEDYAVCRQKGFVVHEMDQSFLDFDDETFHLIWCRHCLEHSIFPYFTISEFYRVLKPKGHLYVEVPASDTSCQHERNRNHYSILGRRMWVELLQRSGFTVVDAIDINHEVPAGPDLYYAFIQQKN